MRPMFSLHPQTANIYYFAEYHDHLKGDRKKMFI